MRTLVTTLAILLGLVVIAAVYFGTPPAGTKTAANENSPIAPAATSTPATAPAPTTQATETPVTAPAPIALTTTAPSTTYRTLPATEARVPTIGSNRKDSGFNIQADLSGWGASILNVTLTRYDASIEHEKPYLVQTAIKHPDGNSYVYPFAARAIYIDGQRVELRVRWNLLSPATYRTTLEPGESTPSQVFDRAEYSLTIVDANDVPSVELRRVYIVEKDSYDIRCEQSARNLTGRPLSIVWEQNTQADMPRDDASYMGDRRLIAVGYLNPEYDPSRKHIYVDKAFNLRSADIDKLAKNEPIWPLPPDQLPKAEMAWFASMNRYFAAVTHSVVPPAVEGKPIASPPALHSIFPGITSQVAGAYIDSDHDHRVLITSITSVPQTLAPGATLPLDLALYAGPRKPEVFKSYPFDLLAFPKLIEYSLGGPCTFVTFQWLAKLLLGILQGFHFLLRDWGLGIILLVLFVRLLLHPITKRAQINMAKMGKQMQTLKPELEKLKKKYKDDQATLNSETMKLYREKGVNPANMLGCLPMFLQTPIWIALYAMLYYAIELRHQPAFYGIFQAISGDKWKFLADLSSSDQFIQVFAEPVKLNLFFIHPNFQSINIIPLLMAIVFYYQQKLTMPPAADEQAAQQQKIMKWMTLLFPVLLYSAPSGLTLYIMASTFAGIVDSLIVKRHIKREEEAGTLFKPAAPSKPGGFRDRIGKMLEEKQRQMMENQQKNHKKKSRD